MRPWLWRQMEGGDPCGRPEVLDAKRGAALQWLQGEIPCRKEISGPGCGCAGGSKSAGSKPWRAGAKGGAPGESVFVPTLDPDTQSPSEVWSQSELMGQLTSGLNLNKTCAAGAWTRRLSFIPVFCAVRQTQTNSFPSFF